MLHELCCEGRECPRSLTFVDRNPLTEAAVYGWFVGDVVLCPTCARSHGLTTSDTEHQK